MHSVFILWCGNARSVVNVRVRHGHASERHRVRRSHVTVTCSRTALLSPTSPVIYAQSAAPLPDSKLYVGSCAYKIPPCTHSFLQSNYLMAVSQST